MQTVLVLYNQPLHAAETSTLESDAGILAEVEAVTNSLRRLGCMYRAVGITSLGELHRCLAEATETIVINLVEFLPSDAQDASLVPAICRAFDKQCTGNGTLALMLGLDKGRSKVLFASEGLFVPAGVVVPVGQVPPAGLPLGPYIVKPLATDASEGIDDHSVVPSAGVDLVQAVQRIHTTFHQPAVVEQFVGSRELNISLLQVGGEVQVLPLAEIDMSALGDRPHIIGYAAKWLVDSFEYQHTPRIIPAPVSEDIALRVRQAALGAWQAIGCRDYARVDMRLDEQERPYIIEVNPNPDIAPDSGFAAALQVAGISFDRFIEILLENAGMQFTQQYTAAVVMPAPVLPSTETARDICRAEPTDRSAVSSMLERCGFFREDEIVLALEVFDYAFSSGSTYQSFVARENGQALGWVVWGATPGTLGTFDIYWLVVDPGFKGKGLGTALVAFTERQITAAQGRLVIIETSGSELYYPTRQFYLRRGYREEARLQGFYAPGDDMVMYTKVIARE